MEGNGDRGLHGEEAANEEVDPSGLSEDEQQPDAGLEDKFTGAGPADAVGIADSEELPGHREVEEGAAFESAFREPACLQCCRGEEQGGQ